MSSGRLLLTFSISSYLLLSALEVELGFHRAVSLGTGFDGKTFILTVECSDAELAVWEIRATVLTFDPGSMLCRQVAARMAASTVETAPLRANAEPV